MADVHPVTKGEVQFGKLAHCSDFVHFSSSSLRAYRVEKQAKEKSLPIGVMTGASVPRSSPRLLL